MRLGKPVDDEMRKSVDTPLCLVTRLQYTGVCVERRGAQSLALRRIGAKMRKLRR